MIKESSIRSLEGVYEDTPTEKQLIAPNNSMVSLQKNAKKSKKKTGKRQSVQLEGSTDTYSATESKRSKEPKIKKPKQSAENPSLPDKQRKKGAREQGNTSFEETSNLELQSNNHESKPEPSYPTKTNKRKAAGSGIHSPSIKRHKAAPIPTTPTPPEADTGLTISGAATANTLDPIHGDRTMEGCKSDSCQKNEVKPDKQSSSNTSVKKQPKKASKKVATSTKEFENKYAVLKNEKLIEQFMAVTMTNNQKGRIRQVLRDLLKGTSDTNLPDVIHAKIESILRSSPNLTDTDLRKIRVLYNMLNTAVAAEKQIKDTVKEKRPLKLKHSNKDKKQVNHPQTNIAKSREETLENKDNQDKKKKVNKDDKVKGPKRYVVFVGNLPKDVDKKQIMGHFSDVSEDIAAVRIPPPREDKKSAIAYVELKSESSYEMALSKHHTMFANKRINVLYTTQKDTKITKAEAKAKTSKLVAMVKSGQLRGSIPLRNKRSQRRARQRAALKAMES